MKECIKCKEVKEDDKFSKKRRVCRICVSHNRKSYRKSYYEDNKDLIKSRSAKYYEDNKESKISYQKSYSIEKKDKIREYKRIYQNEKRRKDPIFKLKLVISRSIRRSLKCKGVSKTKKTVEILGCSLDFLKTYLQDRFTPEMNWSNYGIYWDIDHIIPLSTAVTEEDVIRLNHYTNLQPLDSHTNRNIKRDRTDFY